MKKVLTIAGSDCSGGAGIQADIKTISAHGMYAMSAITALTAQNTTGVSGIFNITPEFVESQLESIFTDIFPPEPHRTYCRIYRARYNYKTILGQWRV